MNEFSLVEVMMSHWKKISLNGNVVVYTVILKCTVILFMELKVSRDAQCSVINKSWKVLQKERKVEEEVSAFFQVLNHDVDAAETCVVAFVDKIH